MFDWPTEENVDGAVRRLADTTRQDRRFAERGWVAIFAADLTDYGFPAPPGEALNGCFLLDRVWVPLPLHRDNVGELMRDARRMLEVALEDRQRLLAKEEEAARRRGDARDADVHRRAMYAHINPGTGAGDQAGGATA